MLVQTYLGGTYVTVMLSAIWPSCTRSLRILEKHHLRFDRQQDSKSPSKKRTYRLQGASFRVSILVHTGMLMNGS